MESERLGFESQPYLIIAVLHEAGCFTSQAQFPYL